MKILVTGATGEVGKATCELLAKEGNELVLVARNTEALSDQVKSIEKVSTVKHSFVQINFDHKKSIEGSLKNIDEINGVVINPPRIPSSDKLFPGETEWLEVFKRVFLNPLFMLKEAISKMPADKRSKVVIISGISSFQVMSKYAVNSAIRAAWLAQAKTLSMNFSHIHFNTISLGGVVSEAYKHRKEMSAEGSGKTFEEFYRADVWNVPLKKYASLPEIARLVSGLLGPFSDHMTGNNLIIDGGYTKSF